MKKTRNVLKAMLAIFAVTSMLFVVSCDPDPVKDEPGSEQNQDSGTDDSQDDGSKDDGSKDDGSKTDDSKDDDSKNDDSKDDTKDDGFDDDSKDDPKQEDKDPEATVKIVIGKNNDVKFTYTENTEDNTLTFIADDGYDYYEWGFFSDECFLPDGKEKTFTLSLKDVTGSVYIILSAQKNGIAYMTTMMIDRAPPVSVDIRKVEFISSTETDVVFNVESEKPVSKDFAKFIVRDFYDEKIAESEEGSTNVTLTLKKESLLDKKNCVFNLNFVDKSGNSSAPIQFGIMQCGDNLFAIQLITVAQTPKSMEIVGSGAMYDYEKDIDSPFYRITDFSTVKISKDCTKIGKNAFTMIDDVVVFFDRDIELAPASFPKYTNIWISEMVCGGNGKLSASVVANTLEDAVPYILYIDGEGEMDNHAFPGDSYPWESYKDKIQMVYIGSGCKTIEQRAFYNYQYLSQLVFEENSTLEVIKSTAFSRTAIEKLEVPASVTSLAGFNNCKNLKEVIFTKDCKLSDISDFSNTAIEKIKIPASVQTIGQNAFEGCTQLKELTFETPLYILMINENAFAGTMLTEVTLDGNKTGYYGSSFPEDCTVTGGMKLD